MTITELTQKARKYFEQFFWLRFDVFCIYCIASQFIALDEQSETHIQIVLYTILAFGLETITQQQSEHSEQNFDWFDWFFTTSMSIVVIICISLIIVLAVITIPLTVFSKRIANWIASCRGYDDLTVQQKTSETKTSINQNIIELN